MSKTAQADRQAFYLLKSVNKAQRKYHLFDDQDTILVAVSGGKDSMSLLDLLHRRRCVAPGKYSLIAGHIQTDIHCGMAVPEEWLRAWCEERGIPLVTDRISLAQEFSDASARTCFRCSWNRRKALFEMADRLQCNKLAFGHHADDIAETTLMNLFYSGRLYRMEPRVSFFEGRLIVIRPLALVEGRDVADYARASGFPARGDPCPASEHSKRTLVRRMLRELEQGSHKVKRSINSAVEQHLALMDRCGERVRGRILPPEETAQRKELPNE